MKDFLLKVHRRQEGQGIVEYALILAFVVVVAAALFSGDGLASSVKGVFSEVASLLQQQGSDTPAGTAKQQAMWSDLDAALQKAIRSGAISMSQKGSWVELDVQQDKGRDKTYTNGGASMNAGVTVNGKGYSHYESLWQAAGLSSSDSKYQMSAGEGWVGVRVVSNGDGSYTSYYYVSAKASGV